MKYIFNFPDIGEGLDEGTIIEWLVKKGQKIESGTLLVTMETDKVVAEIPSPKSGIISAIYGKPGETIKVGDALVEIELEGVFGAEAQLENKIEAVEEEGAGVVGTLEIAGSSAVLRSSSEGMEKKETSNLKSEKKVLATPVARAMAADYKVDIQKIKGTGPGGRVMKEDILKFAEKPNIKQEQKSDYQPQITELVEIEPLSQIRKTIARNMLNSKHKAAHMSVFDEVEISELDRIRQKYKSKYAEQNISLTYLSFVIKATALALKKHKPLNSEMDLENDRMIYKKYYSIGIAVDTEKGLVVPVIHDVDKLSIYQIAKSIQELSQKARERKLTAEDMKDGTFTITSFGSVGGKFAVPVINYPQAGILGIGRVSKQPIVKNDKIEIGLMMPISISVDHRIVDGGEVARFMNSIMSYLSEPVSLIMD